MEVAIHTEQEVSLAAQTRAHSQTSVDDEWRWRAVEEEEDVRPSPPSPSIGVISAVAGFDGSSFTAIGEGEGFSTSRQGAVGGAGGGGG